MAVMKNLSEISIEEEKMADAPSYHLRPDAPAFHPLYEEVNLAIYNDGVPTMSFTSEKDRCRALRDIQDEAIDEGFPPDAWDAAEIDAAEAFVETMALLALLEEQEEKARFEFNHIKKRWEVRRSEGLSGRPKPPRNVVEFAVHDNKNHNAFVHVQSIVPHSHYTAKDAKVRQHHNDTRRDIKAANRKVPVHQSHSMPRNVTQQPRKNN
jgi:hypothetical protein